MLQLQSEVKILLDSEALQDILRNPFGYRDENELLSEPFSLALDAYGCQEIGLVTLVFFFELLFSYTSLAISFYVSLTNLFSIILFLIC